MISSLEKATEFQRRRAAVQGALTASQAVSVLPHGPKPLVRDSNHLLAKMPALATTDKRTRLAARAGTFTVAVRRGDRVGAAAHGTALTALIPKVPGVAFALARGENPLAVLSRLVPGPVGQAAAVAIQFLDSGFADELFSGELLSSIGEASAGGLFNGAQSLGLQGLKLLAPFLPPGASQALSLGLPLLEGGSLNDAAFGALAHMLPPEMQPLVGAFQKMGGLAGITGIELPQFTAEDLLSAVTGKTASGADAAVDGSTGELAADAGSGKSSSTGAAPFAARIGDLRACPGGTGPIFTGQVTVFIGGTPAARVGDLGLCTGPPDAIQTGAPFVEIGNALAARMGDATAHGGKVLTGCPTVMIGDRNASPCAATAAESRAGVWG